MTKEVAEKIVRGITDKIECNTVDIDDWAEFWGFTREDYEELLYMAIKALEQEPCEDAVSRQAAIETVMECYDNDELFEVYEDKLRELPSAQPKIGKWILSGGYWRCSECKEKALLKLDKAKGNCKEYEPVRSIFCPNCGMKMLQTNS